VQGQSISTCKIHRRCRFVTSRLQLALEPIQRARHVKRQHAQQQPGRHIPGPLAAAGPPGCVCRCVPPWPCHACSRICCSLAWVMDVRPSVCRRPKRTMFEARTPHKTWYPVASSSGAASLMSECLSFPGGLKMDRPGMGRTTDFTNAPRLSYPLSSVAGRR